MWLLIRSNGHTTCSPGFPIFACAFQHSGPRAHKKLVKFLAALSSYIKPDKPDICDLTAMVRRYIRGWIAVSGVLPTLRTQPTQWQSVFGRNAL
jgi:hypothetical protein